MVILCSVASSKPRTASPADKLVALLNFLHLIPAEKKLREHVQRNCIARWTGFDYPKNRLNAELASPLTKLPPNPPTWPSMPCAAIPVAHFRLASRSCREKGKPEISQHREGSCFAL